MNGAALSSAFKTLTSGSLWHNPNVDPKHPCKGYADSNPGEATVLANYVSTLAATGSAAPPALATATGRGLVGILSALVQGNAAAFKTAYALLKTGTLWSSTGRCKGYAVANAGEAAEIDAYVADLAADWNATPPNLTTATGIGLVGMMAAAAPSVAPPPPPAQSPDNTVITGTSGQIVDASAHVWKITSDGKVSVDGVPFPETSSVVKLAYESGKVWQLNSFGYWWYKVNPTDVWAPTGGTTVSPVPGDPPPPPPPPPTGTRHWGISPATAYVPDIATQMADFAALGAGCPRLNSSDTAASAARAHGIKTWVVWTDPNFSPAQAVAYCQKYPECIGIEIGNELNLGWGWSLDQTANMQKAFWAAMKAAGLQSKVMLPSVGNGLSHVGSLSMLDWCKGLAARGIKSGLAFTIGNYHNYGLDPVAADNWQHCWTPNSAGESCQSVLGKPPFMVTEFGAKIGWSGVTTTTQAQSATAWVAKLSSIPECIGGQWFLDYDGSAWPGFGLRDASGNPRPSYAAFKAAIATYKAPLHELRPSDVELAELHAAKRNALDILLEADDHQVATWADHAREE